MNYADITFPCMSTQITIKCWSKLSKVKLENTLAMAREEFFRIAQKYTRFSEQSKLSELNRTSGKFFPLDDEFLFLLETTLELAEFSEGRFDPTIIDLLEINGYKASFDRKKIVEESREVRDLQKYAKNRRNWREIELDKQGKRVKLAEGQRIDLGGIGKGYAIDAAAEKLRAISTDFLIDAGGDIYAIGKNGGARWQADLVVGKSQESLDVIGKYFFKESGESLASSGSWARAVGKFHHLLDPDTGAPKEGVSQTFVVHKTATMADGLATVLFLLGADGVDKLRDKYNAQSLLIDSARNIYASDDFELTEW